MIGRTNARNPFGRGGSWSLVALLSTMLISFTPTAVSADPLLVDWGVEFETLAPTITPGVDVENLGDGRYRATVDASITNEWDIYLQYRLLEEFAPPLNVQANIPHTGASRGSDAPEARLLLDRLDPAEDFNVRLTMTTADPADDFLEQRLFTSPDADPTLNYFFDVEDDGDFEVTGGGQGFVEFEVGPGRDVITIAGFVRGANGPGTPFRQVIDLDNEAPVFEEAHLVQRNAQNQSVIIAFSAVDIDGDTVQYSVQWGDGDQTETEGNLAGHTYPAGPGIYQIQIRATDGRGAEALRGIEVRFDAPPANADPVFELLELVSQDGFDVIVTANATDTDGDDVTYIYDWGDGSPAVPVEGNLQSHAYPDGAFGNYVLTVMALDGRGGSDDAQLDIRFVAPPVNQPPTLEAIHLFEQDGFNVTLGLQASDANNDVLTFEIDWGDGSGLVQSQGPFVEHAYPPGAFVDYRVQVTVSDGRGLSDFGTLNVGFDAPDANRDPVIETVSTISRHEFEVTVQASAADADGDDLTYEFDWGDGSPTTIVGGGVAVHTYPEAAHRYNVSVTVTDGQGGSDQVIHPVQFVAPAENRDPVMDLAEIIRVDGFTVTVAANATDPDGDVVHYSIDWGDGSAATENTAGVGQHTYPIRFVDYDITITATDSDGAEDQTTLNVDFPEPPPNSQPVIDLVQVIRQEGFSVTLAIGAHDDDEDPLSYRVTWGDGVTEEVHGGVAQHDYPANRFRPYTVDLLVQDGRGGFDSERVVIDFPQPPANQGPSFDQAQILDREGFFVVVGTHAVDPEGDPLTYVFDWGDGSDATVQGSGIAAHRYPEGEFRAYAIDVAVTDGMGERFDLVRLDVEFEAPADNQPPVIRLAEVISRDGFDVSLAVDASDPDGDPLVYTFEWGDGSEDDVTGGGVAAHQYPIGEFRNYTATVTVRDGRGGSATAEVALDFPAPPDNLSPTFEVAELVRKDGFHVVVAVNAVDADGDALTYRFDWGDGSDPTVSAGGVAEHDYPDGVFATYTVLITAHDGHEGSDATRIDIDFPAPAPNRAPAFDLAQEIDRDGFRVTLAVSATDPDGDQVSYEFNWGDESDVTETTSGVVSHTFPVDQYEAYMVVVTAQDSRGGTSTVPVMVEFLEPPPNIDPVIEAVQLIRQGDWDVTATVGARDADGDPLTFTINWGDGSEPTVNADGVAGHTYPAGVYRPYTVTVQVDDGQGGQAEATEAVNFPNPPANRAPSVEEIEVAMGPRGRVDLVVTAFDPEGEALTYRVHWGDEDDERSVEALPSGTGGHDYAVPQDGAYRGFVIVRDASGGETEAPFVAPVIDQPTVIREVVAEHVEDGTVRFNVVATDNDGVEFLTYSFDFDDDGAFDVIDAARASTIHHYANPGAHRFMVRVTDTWSGQSVQQPGRLELAPWVAPNQAPELLDLGFNRGPRGHVSIVAQGFDADGDALQYSIHWGDEDLDDAEVPMVNGQAEHNYAFDAELDVYEGFVKVTDESGTSSSQAFQVIVLDAATDIQSVTADNVGGGIYEVTIVANDPDTEGDLTYSYDFDGDGEWELTDVARSQARHQFVAPGDYQLRVQTRDGWSGVTTSQLLELQVVPWIPDNQPPVIDGFDLDIAARGHVTVRANVRDPEGGEVRTFIQWGDEGDAGRDTEYVGDRVSHNYEFRAEGWAYQGRLTVSDAQGATIEQPFVVRLVDAPTEIRRFETERVREGTWLLRVDATDPDQDDDLTYSFDFEADGTWDVVDQPGNQVVHTFNEVGDHQVRLGVRDGWSGVLTEGVFVVGSDREGTPNVAPRIDDLALNIAPGGQAKLRVDATDPEGGSLTVEVAWGDTPLPQFEPLVGGQGTHGYDFPSDGRAYDGRVRVTDAAGLTTLATFSAEVIDHPTTVSELTLSVLRDGKVFATVAAEDPDVESLTYDFDMDGDGLSDSGVRMVSEFVYEYRRGGTYYVGVTVTDPWSGIVTEFEREFVLQPWVSSAPVAEDHLEGEEGRCLVLRLDDGRVTSESGQAICDRDQNPNADLWRWDFGDGTLARGSEVGHIYPNDGIFLVTVEGGEASQPIRSTIEVLVVNVAPAFITQPSEFAQGGETYFYTIELSDQGPEDEIRLELTAGLEGMFLEPLGNRQWQLSWDVPQEMEGMFEIELRATDGHMVDDVWQPDGGETIQRYRLMVSPTPIPDAAPPEPDAFLPTFENITGDQIGCAATDFNGQPWAILGLLLLLGLSARRRR